MLFLAGSVNACDGGAAERAREQAREEERVRQAERDLASASAKIQSLQQQIEREEGESVYRVRPPLSSNPEIEALLSAARASATVKPRTAPKCNCKPDDPLCDCL